VTLSPEASLIGDPGYVGGGTGFRANTSANPQVVSQYCNGSRWPPEFGAAGYQVPPGISDATVPNPIFNLTPAATVDEGNNWINISWGPLSLTNPAGTTVLGNYAPATGGSPVVNYITPALSLTTYNAAPPTDFFGHARKTNNAVDIGAIEFAGAAVGAPTLTSISPASHTRGGAGFTVTLTGTGLTGANAVTLTPAANITVSNINVVSDTTVTATFTISAGAARTARNVTVTTPGGTSNAVTFTVVAPVLTSVTPPSGNRGTSVSVTIAGSGFTAATGVTVSGGVGATAITVSGFTVVSDAQITATFNVPVGAALGGHNVTVVVPGGNTGTLPFTVTGATIAFSAPSPALNGGGTTTKNGTITVSNTATGANAGPFTFTAAPTIAKTSGTGNGTFSITGGTCVSGFVINAGSNCSINVSYSGETNTATANGRVTATGTGIATASQNSATFPAN
jgi:hypothetical protein